MSILPTDVKSTTVSWKCEDVVEAAQNLLRKRFHCFAWFGSEPPKSYDWHRPRLPDENKFIGSALNTIRLAEISGMNC